MSDSDHLKICSSMNFRIATYREIADRFQLGSPDAARIRAKRAGWEREPTNHPLDPARVRVPLIVWDQVNDRTHDRNRTTLADSVRSTLRTSRNSPPPINQAGTAPTKAFSEALAILREQLERERTRADTIEQEGQKRVEAAERRATAAEAELQGVREVLSRKEGELDGLKLAAEHSHDVLAQARRETREALDQAANANRQTEVAERIAQKFKQEAEQLRARRLLARLLNLK
jgi:hypothetical protein